MLRPLLHLSTVANVIALAAVEAAFMLDNFHSLGPDSRATTTSGGGVTTTLARSRLDCASGCVTLDSCGGFNVLRGQGHVSCEYVGGAENVSVTTEAGWEYWEKEPAPLSCPDGWTAFLDIRRCYAFQDTALEYAPARDACTALYAQAHLAGFETEAERNAVISIVGQLGIWLGGRRPSGGQLAEFLWEGTGSDIRSGYNLGWYSGQPTATGDCMKSLLGYWFDDPCTGLYKYVCELEL